MTTMLRLTSELLLRAYATGIFPMAQSRRDRELYWIDPEWRGILPLDRFHVPRRLRRTLRNGTFEVRIDTAFREIMLGCAEVTAERPDSWINDEIIAAYTELFTRAMPTASNAGWAMPWSAGYTACRWAARSSARACSRG